MYSFDPSELTLPQRHHLIIGGVAPRPIAWVSTISKEGQPNIAPYSFFNAFSSNPPVLAFSPARRGRDGTLKDTYKNLKETGECVIHIVTRELVEQMNLTSSEYSPDVDESIKAGLEMVDAVKVKPKRIKGSPIHYECTLRDMIPLGDQPGSGNLALLDVVQIHIREDLYQDQRVMVKDIDQVGRNGGNSYTACNPQTMFDVPAPRQKKGIGFDGLPPALFQSGLTKNELAMLASVEKLPEGIASLKKLTPKNVSSIQSLLKKRSIDKAWHTIRLDGNQ